MAQSAGSIKERMPVYPEGFAADKEQAGLGVAFDLGTTTVAGILWDLKEGRQLSVSAEVNPQIKYGRDVISRILSCGRKGENVEELRRCVIGCMNGIIDDLCEKAKRGRKEVSAVTVCGNTVMSHIFAGYSPDGLAMAPFQPAYEGMLDMCGRASGLNIPDDVRVVLLPNIAGHVGGDVTAGIIASGIFDMEGLTIFADLGTNGEIVLVNRGEGFACSTAAGPAFEGNATGLKGSEIIDSIAGMLDSGCIDVTGRLVMRGREGDSLITQKDIRDIQLAKGAIRAGIEMLLKKAGKEIADIDRVIIAGAFGNCISREGAVRIGLIPPMPLEKIFSAGNAAGAGAAMAMVNADKMKLAEAVPSLIEHVELAEEPDFQSVYLGAMNFSAPLIPIELDMDECRERAENLFIERSGLTADCEKNERMRRDALAFRERIANRIRPKGGYYYYERFQLDKQVLSVKGVELRCAAFERMNPEAIEGVYVYAVTAGDFLPENMTIMEQLYGDIWGTAFTDAVREMIVTKIGDACREENVKFAASDSFAPGFYGMDPLEMRKIPLLINFEDLGMELKESGVIVPVKSCVGIVFKVNDKYEPVGNACKPCRGSRMTCRLCSLK
ncbi:MAG: ASKHA domain-containing protein [Bacillota bacterium]|nr:ASKHA domain-containing protein [Bacillota bacterium]